MMRSTRYLLLIGGALAVAGIAAIAIGFMLNAIAQKG